MVDALEQPERVPQGFFGTVASYVKQEGHFDMVLRVTAVMLVLDGASSVVLEALLRVVCALILVVPSLMRRGEVWWAMLAMMIVANLFQWYSIDNHKYLMMYWVLACAVTLSAGLTSFRDSARTMIAGVFILATLWKIIAGQFVDGSFLYVTFLTDQRLIPVAAFVARLPLSDLAVGGEAVRFLVSHGGHGASLTLPAIPSLQVATLVLSWLTLAVEGSIALLHCSGSSRLYHARHAIFMTFVFFTYFLFPVTGFAFVLGVMGLAQCEEGDWIRQATYIGIIGVVQLTLIPWRTLLS